MQVPAHASATDFHILKFASRSITNILFGMDLTSDLSWGRIEFSQGPIGFRSNSD